MSFSVYKSSAGSGKTYALVKEYLKIVLASKSDNRYKNILAITFTNKAAAEMKERIMEALTKIAYAKNPEGTPYYLLQDLKAELEMEEGQIREKCAVVLTSMLHHYSDIAISTIDKFVYKLVRNFAYDLELPHNFSVELDADTLLQTAIDLLLAKVGEDEKLTQALIAFSERKVEDEKNWNIDQDLKSFAFHLLNEQSMGYLKKIKNLSLTDFFLLRKKLEKFIADFENELSELGDSALKIISKNDIKLSDLAGGESKGIGKYFTYLSNKRSDKYEPTVSHLKYVEAANWAVGKAGSETIAKISSFKSELKQLFEKALKVLARDYKNYLSLNAVNKTVFMLSLISEIEKVIGEIKRENSQVHISEFNSKIASIIRNEPVPFIFERLGEKYKNYLIDEFQDTSILQWQNFIPLIENSLATGEFNMLVGDAKQAIYRWRGGEVEQFTQLPQLLLQDQDSLAKEREASLVRNFNEKVLAFNRRSKREIVEFNNSFFEFIVSRAEFPTFLKPIYHQHAQKFDVGNTGGYVQLNLLEKTAELGDYDEMTCAQVHQTILDVLNDNFELKDIAILVRNNKKAVEIANYLLDAGVEVISKESLLLSSSAKVNFIVSAICYLTHPQDLVSKACMMEFLIKQDVRISPANLNTHFAEPAFFSRYLKTEYPDWVSSKLLQLSIFELGEELVRIFKLNREADPYLIFFLDALHKFVTTSKGLTIEFKAWWGEKKNSLSIVIPDGLNAVNIMTIHKSKGLEFPVVIFPYANWMQRIPGETMWANLNNTVVPELQATLLPFGDGLSKTEFAAAYSIESGKKELDDLNILYVAFTRAINRLYVISEPADERKKIASYYVEYLKSTGLWQDNQLQYSFGKLMNKEKTERKNAAIQMEELNKIISNDWRDKLQLSSQSDRIWNAEDLEKDKDYGNLVHTALAKIGVAEDIPKVVNAMLLEGLIAGTEKELLQKKLEQLLINPFLVPYFEKGLVVKTETEILTSKGKTYRPDRVVFYPEKTVVLDYKTGVQLEKHKTQIRNYGAMLSQMGYPKVEQFLVYTETEKLVSV